MDTNNRAREQRERLVPILTTIGTGSVVAAVISLMGVNWPWLLLVFGIVVLMVAAVLASPSSVKWLSPLHAYRWLVRTYIWRRYGPEYVLYKPSVTAVAISNPDGSLKGIRYEGELVFDVKKNRDRYPLAVSLASASIHIRQGREGEPVYAALTTWGQSTNRWEIAPGQGMRCTQKVAVDYIATRCPDLGYRYDWGTDDIKVTIRRAGTRNFRKGIRYKREKALRIGI